MDTRTYGRRPTIHLLTCSHGKALREEIPLPENHDEGSPFKLATVLSPRASGSIEAILRRRSDETCF